jgi:RecA/RadA recombinase
LKINQKGVIKINIYLKYKLIMAKVVKAVKQFEFSKIGSILDNIGKTIPIQIEKEIKEKKFITTGVYLLDAALSARMLGGGVATNRISAVAVESGAGKSFVAFSIAKNAQKLGYSIIYIDTEQAIDLEDLPKFGVDNSLEKFRLIRSNKVEDVNMLLTQLIDELKTQKMAGFELHKIMIVIDSLGQMASNKEKEDLLSGSSKADFTKSKALSSLFRSINTDLGYLDIPLIVCNQTYLSMDMFPKSILRGGNGLLYSASVIGFMSKAQYKTGDEDAMDLGASGITVTFKTQKNRLAKPKKIKFDISFASGMNPYTGLQEFCRPEYYEKIGIAKGKMDVDKSTGEMKFVPGGTRWYVRHLDKSFFLKQLFKPQIFTQEVLEAMNPIVSDYFAFKSVEEIEEVEKQFNEIVGSVDEDGFDDDFDADDLFE